MFLYQALLGSFRLPTSLIGHRLGVFPLVELRTVHVLIESDTFLVLRERLTLSLQFRVSEVALLTLAETPGLLLLTRVVYFVQNPVDFLVEVELQIRVVQILEVVLVLSPFRGEHSAPNVHWGLAQSRGLTEFLGRASFHLFVLVLVVLQGNSVIQRIVSGTKDFL